jgi:hypothetical protein
MLADHVAPLVPAIGSNDSVPADSASSRAKKMRSTKSRMDAERALLASILPQPPVHRDAWAVDSTVKCPLLIPLPTPPMAFQAPLAASLVSSASQASTTTDSMAAPSAQHTPAIEQRSAESARRSGFTSQLGTASKWTQPTACAADLLAAPFVAF